ncbi:hypothetical protein [Fischerella thermalis]|uniref:Uncharacterized protein n=1 Tax=Fischerella thermalis CCMEE 5318 TaxID=2019666 RepID=A0A2N6LPD5_9CYAN|nr:hypothetical protein [Fischerella thermalis]PMB27577.1 hypothetical protein CEN46_01165 [Fischerella thermalis CCMEE 5318]
MRILRILAVSTILTTFFSGNPLVYADETIPTVTRNNGDYQLKTVDWSRINWANLPPVERPGYIKVPQDVVQKIGYDPSRTWSAGQKLDSIIMLGDVDDAFKLSSVSLKNISAIVPTNYSQQKLKDFGLMKWQTIASLVKAIPELGNLDVNQVKPIEDLLALSGITGNGALASYLQSHPTAANLPFSKLDLSRYSINSIPGLATTQLEKFKDWQRALIKEIPGLNQIPFDKMPQPISDGNDVIGVASLVLGQAEHGDPMVGSGQFVSGRVNSNDVTVSVPCNVGAECSYLELGDLAGSSGGLYGKRWVSGSSQKVKGGFGILANVNGGLEPTGRLVYGNAFKVVLTGVSESTGTADFGLYFRFCTHIPFSGKTCTPYFIGPVPWIPVREKDLVVIGTGQ